MSDKIEPYTKDFILGDTHAYWGKLNQFIQKKRPRTLFIAGDFGYWPGEKGYELDKIKNGRTKIYWCDGNHENHERLIKFLKLHPFALSLNTPIEIAPNIFYCPRGTILYHEGQKVLFFGGALSVDKHWRTPGFDWFPEETINYEDLDRIDGIGKVDIVISHTCPESCIAALLSKGPVGYWDKKNDSSTQALEWILETHKPDRWYFGHWHEQCYGLVKGCRWTALNMMRRSGWFTEFPK